jgi:hypothetical protein
MLSVLVLCENKCVSGFFLLRYLFPSCVAESSDNVFFFIYFYLRAFVFSLMSESIKLALDVHVGRPSQCLLTKHVYDPDERTMVNILYKVNGKLGGVNHVVRRSLNGSLLVSLSALDKKITSLSLISSPSCVSCLD